MQTCRERLGQNEVEKYTSTRPDCLTLAETDTREKQARGRGFDHGRGCHILMGGGADIEAPLELLYRFLCMLYCDHMSLCVYICMFQENKI